MTKKWYYGKDGKQHGPVELSEIKALLSREELTPDSYIWNSSMGKQWKRASSVPELHGEKRVPAAPPPSPPVAPEAGTQNRAYVNPAVAALIRSRGPATHRVPDSPPARESRSFSLAGILAKLVLLAVVCGGGYYVWQTYFHKSAPARVYEEFAHAFFEARYDDALLHCAEGPAWHQVMQEKILMTSPTGQQAMRAVGVPAHPEVMNKRYKVLSQTRSKDKQSVELKMKQAVRILTEYSPFQALIVNIHTATLIKDGDTWKVSTFLSEHEGTYNPMSGQKMD